MLICLYYWESKTDLLELTYIVLTIISTIVETDIPTWCSFSTYPKDILTNYVS